MRPPQIAPRMLTTLLGMAIVLSAIISAPVRADMLSYQQIPLQKFPEHSQVQLADLPKHKPFYVKLWASWCQPCMQQMPHFEHLHRTYGDKVNFIAVNIDINEEPSAIQQVIAQFGLTMPVWVDHQGKLALQLGLIGTPFSVLFNSKGEQVYSSHESDAALDGLLKRLAAGQQLPTHTSAVTSALTQQQQLAPLLKGEHYVFITATWCDWYLKESRPPMALQCQTAQQQLNSLAAKLPQGRWHGIVNNLWTDDKALNEFNALYNMQVPFSIDQSGIIFAHFNVRQIPLLLKLSDGQVVTQITDFSNIEQVIRQLQ